jgi:hypothetical protein
MTAAISVLIVVMFLLGALIGVFILLVIGIRKEDRHERLPETPRTHIEAIVRRVLGVSVRNDHPDSDSDSDSDSDKQERG